MTPIPRYAERRGAAYLIPASAFLEFKEAPAKHRFETVRQDYLERYPNGYFIRPNWTLPSRAETRRAG
jgi:hypothetical protein